MHRTVHSLVKSILPKTVNPLLSWPRRFLRPVERTAALEEEIDYWRKWFTTGGLEYQEDFRERLDPNQPIQDHVATYIERLQTDDVDILDVGSGPLTKIGKVHPSKNVRITATDLLAKQYDGLLEELRITPVVRTIYADAERLVDQFGENRFDIVNGQNCIDHTANPLTAIEQMLAVCRPNGFVVLFHAEKEGQNEGYKQLHQWDFMCKQGSFVIRSRSGQETNVTVRLAALGLVECARVLSGGDFAIVTGIRKNGVSGR